MNGGWAPRIVASRVATNRVRYGLEAYPPLMARVESARSNRSRSRFRTRTVIDLGPSVNV